MRIFIITMIIVAVILLVYYLYFEDNVLITTKYDIKDKKLSKNFKDFKIAHLSDFHNTKLKRLHVDLKNKLEEEKPDIIVITGDLIDSNRTNVNLAMSFIDSIKDITDIYYIPGNHESRVKEYAELKKRLIASGIHVLEKDSIELDNGIILSGVKDPAFLRTKNNTHLKRILEKEVDELNLDTSKYNILLSHRPEGASIYAQRDIDLVLAGHAHGGQIRVFGQGLFAPGQGVFPRYTAGLHDMQGTKLIISRGIGNSEFPFRINNRPELIMINLQRGE